MKRIRIGLGIFLTIILISFSAHAEFKEHGGFAEGQILVKFRADTLPSMIERINRSHRTEVEDVIPGINVHVLRIPPGIGVSEMVKRYNEEVSVEYAEPNYIAYAILDVNDPYFGLQWG